MMNPWATTTDLQDRSFRTLTSDEVRVGEFLLDDAQSLILQVVPDAAEAGPDDQTLFALLVQIQCAMVLRVVNNPTGVRSRSKGIDDFTETETIDSSRSAGELYLTDAEQGRLSAATGDLTGAFTIGSTPKPVEPDWWDEWGSW